MTCPNSLLRVYIIEKVAANPVIATHRRPRSLLQGITMRKFGNPFLGSLLIIHTCRQIRIDAIHDTIALSVSPNFVQVVLHAHNLLMKI